MILQRWPLYTRVQHSSFRRATDFCIFSEQQLICIHFQSVNPVLYDRTQTEQANVMTFTDIAINHVTVCISEHIVILVLNES